MQHTFSNLAKCVTIFSIFWQDAVRRACSLTFLNRYHKDGPYQEETKNQYIYQSNEEDGHQLPIHQ
ncbi:hypothetical protein [Neobacillus sp. 204]|uniref:hypothetical protein n=1 Tax=Neobacillus sp. 204 TaxID=3383351 RepID=UPI00397D85A1